MNQQLWIAALTFLATLITLAIQTLPVTPELLPWLNFAILAINAALTAFFGVAGFRARAASKAAKR